MFEIQRKDFPNMRSALKIISIPNSQSEIRSYQEENYDFDNQSVEKLGHTVEKSVTSRSTLTITLDIKINDDMPQKFTDAVKEVYNACEFDNGSYSWMFFKIKNEYDNHPDDRCRIVFNKGNLVI